MRKLLFIESKFTKKPIVFDIHPNECIREEGNFIIERRTKNYISYLFADKMRRNLKLNNLGDEALGLLEKEIVAAKNFGFEFITCKEFREAYENFYNNNG